ncbi:hypothetical protein ABMA28_000452 [Loxostege sticticalis]|uniref:V-type proton ATPase subunit a n=1 Tax=Loxostege sticticalis TaxID=481309 RepID=A0ABD0TS98_LOXSC
MGHMLRSDLMTLCDVYLQPEAAFKTLDQLGEMGCVQFLDMNAEIPPFQKQYVSELCRCAEMERKLRYIRSEMEKDGIKVYQAQKEPSALPPNEMIALENQLEKWEDDIIEMAANQVNILKNYVRLLEMHYILEEVGPLVGDTEFTMENVLVQNKVEAGELGGQLYVTMGLVARSRCYSFEMMLWRVSRGNIYFRRAVEDKIIKDPQTGLEVRKVAFIAICQGEELNIRTQKVCNGYRVNIYPCPKSNDERLDTLDKLREETLDIEQVLKKTYYHRCKALRVIARQWDTCMVQVKKAKAIYHNLNLFNLDITKNCLIGQCWVPNLDVPRVQDTLQQTSESVGTTVPSFMTKCVVPAKPPTYHRTNKFTHGFQALINAYGDSTYREINPGLFTVVTFPFLFGLMFSDIGHGIILVVFATWMILKEKQYLAEKSDDEIWNIFFGGRYVILLLGVFSIYAGFMFNDIFSRCINISGSYWLNQHYSEILAVSEKFDLNPSMITGRVYWFGIDPVWTLSNNQIMFENSIKMKFSIIIGVAHMMFGICLSLFDHMYFRRYYAILLEFIPQIVFLMCLFCWLIFMIFYKWFKYGAKTRDITLTPGCAPQILILFIDMCLLSKSKPVEDECLAYMFSYQREIQIGLIVVAVLCVPVLLFGTPVYLVYRNKRKREICTQMSNFRRYQRRRDTEVLTKQLEEIMKAKVAKYTTSFGELMIHQSVSTIEYVLSTISHTASYLRLWALSLAHAELSVMLWKMIFRIGLSKTTYLGILYIFLTFAIWAMFTISILVVMEGMSAFLHTLRLHCGYVFIYKIFRPDQRCLTLKKSESSYTLR